MRKGDLERFNSFVEFLDHFVAELNGLSEEGWILLVEGRRDVIAMESIGYRGRIVTRSSLAKGGIASLVDASAGVIILTDMDREGRQLAAKYVRSLSHEGLRASLLQRKRLLAASRGVFRHIENLSRFADFLTH
jgi:5S rRNA maturation endonuclease (ribonuclease M5)